MTEQEYLNAKCEANELDERLTKLRRKITLYEEDIVNVSNCLVGKCFFDTCDCYCIGIKYKNDIFYYVAVDTINNIISIEEDSNPSVIQGYANSIINKEKFIDAYRSVMTKMQDSISNASGIDILGILNGEK